MADSVLLNENSSPHLDPLSNKSNPTKFDQISQIRSAEEDFESLHFIQPSDNGVFIPEESFQASAESWKNTIVLLPVDFKLTVNKLKDYISKVWKPKGNFKIHIASGFNYTVQFDEMFDVLSVLRTSTYSFFGRLLMVFKWYPGYRFEDFSARRVQIWIKLLNLDMELWTNSGFSRIARYIGEPIRSNFNTVNKRITKYARILVEIDLDSTQSECIPITMHNGISKVISVEYEYLPHKCLKCNRFGHKSLIHEISKNTTWNSTQTDYGIHVDRESNIASSSENPPNDEVTNVEIQNDGNYEVEDDSEDIERNKDVGLDFLNSELPKDILPDFLNQVADNINEKLSSEEQPDVSAGITKNDDYLAQLKGVWSVNEISSSIQHLTVHAENVGGLSLFLSVVYASNHFNERRELWNHIVQESSRLNGEWILIGDFNNSTSHLDKRGGLPVPFQHIRALNNCLTQAGLFEIKASGFNFTWRRRGMARNIDKIFLNHSCLQNFTDLKAIALSHLSSDHNPLFLDLIIAEKLKGTPFRYSNEWHLKSGYEACFDKGFQTHFMGFASYVFLRKLYACKIEFKRWNRERPDDNSVLMEAEALFKDRESACDLNPENFELFESMLEAKQNLQIQKHIKSLSYKQKSKISWLQDGDTNSRFFHSKLSAKRHTNNLNALFKDDGSLLYKTNGVAVEAINYFQSLFNGENINELPSFQPIATINDVGQKHLLQNITIEAVKKVVFSVHIDSSPGPDGFNSKFFMLHWDALKFDLLAAI